ncbi:MAG: TetR/AcrR family transcriptional regulator, partial [Micrococcales bacterium]|nr:TetR/AcrR family transcriptional regulator [Micrococcales bacterium]
MAKRQFYSVDQLLDGAQQAILRHGPDATLQQISQQSGAPTGSIYYRFESRDELLGELWLRAIDRWHRYLLAAIETQSQPRAALLAAARAVITYSRQYPDEALAMTLCHQNELAANGPVRLRDRAAVINDFVYAKVQTLGSQVVPTADSQQVIAAVIQIPH